MPMSAVRDLLLGQTLVLPDGSKSRIVKCEFGDGLIEGGPDNKTARVVDITLESGQMLRRHPGDTVTVLTEMG